MNPEPREHHNGTAVLTVLLLLTLLSAIAIGVATVVRVETLIAGQHRHSVEALAAAEAGIEVVIAELRILGEWTSVVAGVRQSPLSQGRFEGRKPVPGAGQVLLCCGSDSAADRLSTATQLSPLPARRALQWRPYLWTTFEALAPRDPPSRLFVVAWVANDEDDRAGAMTADTNDVVLIRSEAIEPGGPRRIVEALVARPPSDSGLYSGDALTEEQRRMRMSIVSWREIR
jgi:hypothetical protein